jgi:hypothetical protein
MGVCINRPQLDYTLLLSELEMDYCECESEELIGQMTLIDEYRQSIKDNDYSKMFSTYPQSIVLRMRIWNALRAEKKWDELRIFSHKYQHDEQWNKLPVVIEGKVESDFHELSHRDFIRKYQNRLQEPLAAASEIKYLAKAYAKEHNTEFYHLAQSRYFLIHGDYQSALKELRHQDVDSQSFYAQELRNEAELKWKIYRALS